eukprot:m.40178 g.40178  ORF g.40178 m.40178 type:complete len:543 (-) comp10406_c0_seq2:86-1714(-)
MDSQPLLDDAYNYDLSIVRATFQNLRHRAYRTLAVICLVDLLFVFLIWVLALGGFQGKFRNSPVAQSITEYTFESSLFDVVCVSVFRSTVLIIAYWGTRLTWSGFIWFSTVGSTLFLLVKIFYFDFPSKEPQSYLVFVISFITPWAQAIVWITTISPLNKRISKLYRNEENNGIINPNDVRQILFEHQLQLPWVPNQTFSTPLDATVGAPNTPGGVIGGQQQARGLGHHRRTSLSINDETLQLAETEDEQSAFLHPSAVAVASRERYASDNGSQYSTPTGSLEELEMQSAAIPTERDGASDTVSFTAHGSLASQGLRSSHARDFHYYQRLATQAMQTVLHYASLSDEHWERHASATHVDDVHSLVGQEGTVYRCRGLVWADTDALFALLHERFNDIARWSKAWDVTTAHHRVDRDTDLVYMKLPKLGWLRQPRDLDLVRKFTRQHETSTIATISAKDPLNLPTEKTVRATDYGSGFHLETVAAKDASHRYTRVTFVFYVDLKVSTFPAAGFNKSVLELVSNFLEEVRVELESSSRARDASLV